MQVMEQSTQEVILHTQVEPNFSIVLREWKEGTEWVTHVFNHQDGGFYYGRYFRDKEQAITDYLKRVQTWDSY